MEGVRSLLHMGQAGCISATSVVEPELEPQGAGARAGAGILKFELQLLAPAPDQTKVVYLIIIHIL